MFFRVCAALWCICGSEHIVIYLKMNNESEHLANLPLIINNAWLG